MIDPKTGEVSRSVIATKDNYLDENPQIAAVTFPGAGKDDKDAVKTHSRNTRSIRNTVKAHSRSMVKSNLKNILRTTNTKNPEWPMQKPRRAY